MLITNAELSNPCRACWHVRKCRSKEVIGSRIGAVYFFFCFFLDAAELAARYEGVACTSNGYWLQLYSCAVALGVLEICCSHIKIITGDGYLGHKGSHEKVPPCHGERRRCLGSDSEAEEGCRCD
ncbi:hypothetical protein BX600DRAFT_161464 [Xylariales sp. PMI_506]|nr:hypothetical protein BX600DRAFT_161464 [Xylariales sp. PMI_506]